MVNWQLDSVRICGVAGLHRALQRRIGTRQTDSFEKCSPYNDAEWFRLDAGEYEEVKAVSFAYWTTYYWNCSISRYHFLPLTYRGQKFPQIYQVWGRSNDNRMGHFLSYLSYLIQIKNETGKRLEDTIFALQCRKHNWARMILFVFLDVVGSLKSESFFLLVHEKKSFLSQRNLEKEKEQQSF